MNLIYAFMNKYILKYFHFKPNFHQYVVGGVVYFFFRSAGAAPDNNAKSICIHIEYLSILLHTRSVWRYIKKKEISNINKRSCKLRLVIHVASVSRYKCIILDTIYIYNCFQSYDFVLLLLYFDIGIYEI